MKSYLFFIFIFLINIVIAQSVYVGESTQIDLSSELGLYSNYTIEGNTSSINISVNDLIATIQIPSDYEVGEFKVNFYGYKADK